ncbi:MAG: efflux transporter outer membrane subunit [Azoarcus sp.]|jgi:multidrug efflux system outer membrane protein|nr:efflux transporter outer membrane subunit [Azoarcus sp.]
MSIRSAFVMAACLLFAGCATVGPDYVRPAMPGADHYRNASPQSFATNVPRIEAWWQVFGDDVLNHLEAQAIQNSPQLAAAFARVQQARAQFGVSAADRWSSLSSDVAVQAAGETVGQSVPGSSEVVRTKGHGYTLPLSATYEIDLWGRIRRAMQSAQANVEASQADQRGVLLTLTADIARYYFALKQINAELQIARDTARSCQEEVEVNESRFRAGLTPDLDVQRARVEAATALSDVADLQRQNAQAVNALAVATGIAPANFVVSELNTLAPAPPPIPAGIPSQLLERRPDLAQAELILRARTADIGVATANRLPSIQLLGNVGYSGPQFSDLFNPANRYWNIGPAIHLPIFDGGRLKAQEAQLRAIAEEALADYRQKTLAAFQEVDDALAALREQSAQIDALAKGKIAALDAVSLSRMRYRRGLSNYLDVIDAERSLLQIERTRLQIIGAQYASTIGLIKGIGGSWEDIHTDEGTP